MIGIIPTSEQTGQIIDNVALHWDTDQSIDPAALREVFAKPEITMWSGASVIANEPFDHIWLWLTATEPGTCRIAAEPAAIEAGTCRPAFAYRTPAIVEGDLLAYLTKPGPVDQAGERRYELGATGHVPAGAALAEQLCEQDLPLGPRPGRPAGHHRYPTGTANQDLPGGGVVIDKHNTRMVVVP